jgi:hypothetical protein
MKHYVFALALLSAAGAAYSQHVVSTCAGNGTPGFVNGDTLAARFRSPFGMCSNKAGNLYIADGGNHCIRKITPAGQVSTLGGTGAAGYKDTTAEAALFNNPTGVCADDSGNVYVSDFQNHRVRKISAGGDVTTIAGNGTPGYADGAPGSASFNYPRGICRDAAGNLYIGDSWNHRIRKIAPDGTVSTFAGGGSAIGVGTTGSLKDAQDTSARFYTPAGVTIDGFGNLYVADAYNHRIRKITQGGTVTTFAGSGPTGQNNGGYANGSATAARFNTPTELTADSSGSLYIGDTFSNRVRRITSSGEVSLWAGEGTAGYSNGPDSVARFSYPRGVAVARGTVYVMDFNNHAVRAIRPAVPTSIHDQQEEEAVRVFPNPSHSSCTIRINRNLFPATIRAEITDISGRLVKVPEPVAGPELLSTGILAPGAYLLSISGGGRQIQRKFIIY